MLGSSRHNSAGTWPGQVCDTVSELAAGITEEGGWPELLPFMFQCVQSGQPRVVEAALLVFAQLARYLADMLRQYLGTLHGVRAAAAPLPYCTVLHRIAHLTVPLDSRIGSAVAAATVDRTPCPATP